MADPIHRWLSVGACRAPEAHEFQRQRATDGGQDQFLCSKCGTLATFVTVAAYRLGFEAAGGDGEKVAPCLRLTVKLDRMKHGRDTRPGET